MTDVPDESAEDRKEFRTLADHSRDVIVRHAPDLTITFMNAYIEEVTGFPPHFYLGKKPSDLGFDHSSIDLWESAIRRALESGLTFAGEWTWPGSERDLYFESRVVPEFNGGSDPKSVLVVGRDITKRVLAEQVLRDTIKELKDAEISKQGLVSRLINAQEEERQRIASDVHDDSIQAIVAASLRLGLIREDVTQPKLVKQIEGVEAILQESIEKLRRLLFDLRPPSLENIGIAQAIKDAFAADVLTETQLTVESQLLSEPHFDLRVSMFRIVQEALTNVKKHAQARHVWVKFYENRKFFFATVHDDGIGFDSGQPQDSPFHLGMRGMRERGQVEGGSVSISTDHSGTTVLCQLPKRHGP